jgi:serine/threonine-protein kinase
MAATPSDDARALPRDDARVGSVLADRYRLNELVGEGGMGKVYEAEHIHMRKRVAVKVLHRELTTVPEVVARFEREAMAAANIDHPNVAIATDFGKLADGAVFLVLEFVQGKNLRDQVAQGPFDIPRALHIARQIAGALGAAHAQSIVHRDLKPENVMLIDKGGDPDFVKVLDFGIAKVPIDQIAKDAPADAPKSGHVITRAGMVFGTPEYMAPEQALGQNVDGRADLYALGVILFEMITGGRPFVGDDKASILGQQLSKLPPRLSEKVGVDVPEAVEQIVVRLLAKEVALRFQKADEVASAVEAVIGPIPRPQLPSSPGLPVPHVGKPTFLPHDPLPRFPSAHTLPRVDGLGGVLKDVQPVAVIPGAAAPVEAPSSVLEKDILPSADSASAPAASRVAFAKELASRVSFAKELASRVSFTKEIGPRAKQWLTRAGGSLDKTRERWPAPLRQKLSRVSGESIVLSGMIASTVLVLVLVIGLLASDGDPAVAAPGDRAASVPATPSASAASAAQATAPSAAELAQAKAAGAAALEALTQKFPESAAAQLELAEAAAAAKQYVKATGAVGRALALDATLKDDPRTARVLFQSAQVKDSQDATFALLEGPMAGRGADILYDLVVQKGVKPGAQTRAERYVRSADFGENASPALKVAVAMRKSKNCDEVRSNLPEVQRIGDERSLPYLEFFQRKTQHYGCLSEGGLLDQTLAAVKKRAGK